MKTHFLRSILSIILIGILFPGTALAHSGKPKYHVIVDTDGAIDDMRAISMLLSGHDIRVLALSCSNGTLPAVEVGEKVANLVMTYRHEGIPVGIFQGSELTLPAWAGFARSLTWGADAPGGELVTPISSVPMLSGILEHYEKKITLVALGSLETYATLFEERPDLAEKVERILWFNAHKVKDGFNYQCAPGAYARIMESGVALEVVSAGKQPLQLDQAYLEMLEASKGQYAYQISTLHAQPQVKERIATGHLKLWDDLLPLYMTVPVLFNIEKQDGMKLVSLQQGLPGSFMVETIGKLLASSEVTNNRVFQSFPMDTALYGAGYRELAATLPQRFGLEEWKAICMTNEVHGHTGIYSIIGAKAGIRAMDYFNVGINNVEILTFAGSKPPLSCFNDGLQISSGATIGQGLITVSDSISSTPSALFSFNGRVIRMAIKPEIAAQMRKEISYGVKTYGKLTDPYWLYIEELAKKYWAEMDRNEIFDIEAVL